MSSQTRPIDRINGDPAERERIARMLACYPRISSENTAEIIRFLRRGPHFDVGILMGDFSISAQLDAFMADHKKQFVLKVREIFVALVGILGALLVCWALWEMAK